MDKNEFITNILKRVSTVSVGGSTTRGRPEKTLSRIRTQLFSVDLDIIKSQTDQNIFINFLSDETNKLKSIGGVGDYGLARKCINLFLRDCFYNTYLNEYYELTPVEGFLEIPIDSVVAKALRKYDKTKAPVWKNIYSLSEKEHQEYQYVATNMAVELEIHRVHLDFLWTDNRNS